MCTSKIISGYPSRIRVETLRQISRSKRKVPDGMGAPSKLILGV